MLQRRLAATVYGRAHGIEAGLADKVWRERAPLSTYETLAPYLARVRKGEADVLWPGRCDLFAVSSGTTGAPKLLPVTPDLLGHFRGAGLDSLLFYCARSGTGFLRGKHLCLAGASELSPLPEARERGARQGEIGAILAGEAPAWAKKTLCEPGDEIARIGDWPAKIEAVAHRCAERDVRALAGLPNWLVVLGGALLHEKARTGGGRPATLREIWPNLECLVHSGLPVAPFAAELRALCGPGVNFHEIYVAGEGFVAAQDAEPEAGLRLLADAGVHYEFIPLADYDETRLAALGPRALPLEGVRAGLDYVLVMTTPGGLVRHIPGDIVRFVSVEPARLVFAGRTRQRLSAFGEQVVEKDLTDALATVCGRHGWHTVNFHVAPLFSGSLTGSRRGSHEWWLELRAGSEVNPTGPVIAPLLDAELQRLNRAYEAKRRAGDVSPPTVRLVMPGVFEKWLRAEGRWGGQHKTPRCASDRRVADALAKYAPFHDAV